MSRKGGVLSGGFQPLKAPNAPTVDSVSAGILSASVTVSAPANTGDGTVSGYVVTAKQSDGSLATGTASSAGAVSVTLTAGGTTEFAAQAFSEYGPGQFSGFGNSTAVPTGQELYTWGSNFSGQLGHNNTIDLSSPVQVGALVDWQTVISGSDHRLAIKTNGSLWAWGENNNGQLGINTVVDVSSPIQIGALTNWLSVSAGVSISFAIKTDGSLWSWGKANGGILGNNTTIDLSSPVQVGASTDWYSISLRGENCFGAIKTDGSLWTWGVASYGGLGSNNTTNQSSPVQLGSLTNWASVSSANHFMLATKADGTLWAWGSNGTGQLGQNDRVYRSSPVQIGALTNWASVSAGTQTAGAVKTDGTLWGWGSNSDGNLGDGTKYNYRSSPVQVGALTTWSQVSTTVSGGFRATIGLKTDGTIWTWGNNSNGCLGTNTGSAIVMSPVQVGASTNWGAVSFGTRSAAAIQQSFT